MWALAPSRLFIIAIVGVILMFGGAFCARLALFARGGASKKPRSSRRFGA